MKIDLKHSLWSAHPDTWMDHEPEKYPALVEAIERGERVTVYTAPRKEVRSGTVEVWKTSGTYNADVRFHAEWDDAESHLSHLGLEESDLERVEAALPRNDNGDPGISCDDTVTADTFEELLKKIDEIEERLIAVEEEQWTEFESQFTR